MYHENHYFGLFFLTNTGIFSKDSSPFDDTVKDAGEAEKGYSLPRSDLTPGRLYFVPTSGRKVAG